MCGGHWSKLVLGQWAWSGSRRPQHLLVNDGHKPGNVHKMLVVDGDALFLPNVYLDPFLKRTGSYKFGVVIVRWLVSQ